MAMIIHYVHNADTPPIFRRIGDKDFSKPLPFSTIVATISANGEEREFIQSAFSNLPTLTNPKPEAKTYWRGDFKDFIVCNWESLQFPEPTTIQEPT